MKPSKMFNLIVCLTDKDSCGATPPPKPELRSAKRFIHCTFVWILGQAPYVQGNRIYPIPERGYSWGKSQRLSLGDVVQSE
jgi:hypothetical protein